RAPPQLAEPRSSASLPLGRHSRAAGTYEARRRGRGAQAASRRADQREDAAFESDKKMLVLVLVTRQRSPLARIVPAQRAIHLQPAPYPLEERGDVHERAERLRHEAPEDRGRVLDLVDGVRDQLVDAAGLEGGEVGHLGQVAARAGEV